MNKRTILMRNMSIEYDRRPDGTTIELRNDGYCNDGYWLVYGTDEPMTLKQIAEELNEEIMIKYMNKQADYDDYYDRYSPGFLREVGNALLKLIEEEG